MGLPHDLGDIKIANLYWQYDHELDPLNLIKVCVLLCSDHLYVESITIAKLIDISAKDDST